MGEKKKKGNYYDEKDSYGKDNEANMKYMLVIITCLILRYVHY